VVLDSSASANQAVVNAADQNAARSDQGQERAPRNSSRGGRGERNRGDRNRPQDDSTRGEIANANNAVTPGERSAVPANDAAPGIDQPRGAGESANRADGGEPREKRSRDRYGRERSPRTERSEQGDQAQRPSLDAQAAPDDMPAEPRKSYFSPNVEVATADAAPATAASAPAALAIADKPLAPVALVPEVAPTATPTQAALAVAVTPGLPKLQPFVLPLAELAEVAQSSGLNWINSDVEKIAAVQAAIAAEPKGIHVPRERPAIVHTDAGPLILVETKRDLGTVILPFESAQQVK
jgi:ribonuclease E